MYPKKDDDAAVCQIPPDPEYRNPAVIPLFVVVLKRLETAFVERERGKLKVSGCSGVYPNIEDEATVWNMPPEPTYKLPCDMPLFEVVLNALDITLPDTEMGYAPV